jgi:type II secretory ATPase GspE/PulE/Tfp pilus assembly ATPase PilB-like protein
MVSSESTVKLVNNIIEGAVNSRATDIHLEPQEDNLRVRYRVDGMLYDLMRIPGDQAAATVSRIKVLAHMDITERRRPQDGHVSVKAGRREISLRASTLPTNLGEKVVLRVIQDTSVVRGLPQLGLSHDEITKIKEMISRPHGMFLVTGPMGSGKTTTLYAALGEVNTPSRNIVTIEDPIEYSLPGVSQVQVDVRVDLNFASGLRAILRQDANILMVGEIRDSETAGVAARAASTGHLLFSSLHTNTAVGAVSTLRHLGVPSFMIANTLICVVAQRLARKVCPNCAESYVPPKSVAAALGLVKNSKQEILRAKGCDDCLHTGYVGRTGIYEILKISEPIAALITDEKSEREILEASLADGQKTLAANAIQKVLDGVTTAEELFRIIVL